MSASPASINSLNSTHSVDLEEWFARSSYAAPDVIVVATSLTDLDSLVPQAIAEAASAHAELVFVHAIAPDRARSSTANLNPYKADRDARLALEVVSRQVRSHGLSCRVVVRHGAVRDVVEEQIQECGAGRLLLSARAKDGSGSESARLGSTARRLLAHQRIPVSCVSSFMQPRAEASFVPRKILYPLVPKPSQHGRSSCHREQPLAQELSKYFRAQLIVLEQAKKECRATDQLGSCLFDCPMGLWPQAERWTLPVVDAAAILRAAREHAVDWIVLDRATALDPEPLMAEVEAVMAGATCPVLIVQSIAPVEEGLVPLSALSIERSGAITLH